jgi:predicted esterase
MKQHSTTILLVIVLFLSSLGHAQNEREKLKVGQISNSTGPEVTFLEDAPVIDGLLDKNLESLPIRIFPLVSKRKMDPFIPMSFRMAYGASFFYLYVEAEAKHLYCLDRAFWFGDGFRILIAAPKPNNEPADEYYELGCSAVNRPELEWSRQIFLAINLNKLFVRTSPDVKFEFREGNGKISFELFLPWKDIVPFHPFLSDAIGFNLSFAKAMGPSGGQATAYYQIVDSNLYDFGKTRNYALLAFQKPKVKREPQVFVSFKEEHIAVGDPVHATIAAVSSTSLVDTIKASFQRGNERTGDGLSETMEYKPGLTTKKISVATMALKPGNGYSIRWNSSANPSCSGASPLVIMPEFDQSHLGKKLADAQKILSKSSLSTLQFQINELAGQLKQLKKYETGNDEYLALDQLLKSFESVEQGFDPFKSKTGYIRKAYRSKVDQTFQPYMVYLPPNFDQNKKYPLFVFLHGAEETEKTLIGTDTLLPGEFILLGPFGRGTTNGFAVDHAQEDIAEAIDAVREDYPIDDSNIILSGVSMGGYGVYRTFFETPQKFKAVAVFAGLPYLETITYPDGQPTPNFLDEQKLTVFKNLPMFIFHGEKDQNAPFALTRELVDKLRRAGAKVEFITEPEKGHGEPSKENWQKFSRWVENVIKPNKTS